MATGDASKHLKKSRLLKRIHNELHNNPLYYNKTTTTDSLFRVAWLEHQKGEHDELYNERATLLSKLKRNFDALDRRFEYLDRQENLLYQKAKEVFKDFDPSSTSSGSKRTQEPATSKSNKSAKMSESDDLSVGVQDISLQDELDASASTSDSITSDFEILVTDIDELLREMAAEEELELCSITTGDELSSIEELELSGNTIEDELAKEELSSVKTRNEMDREDIELSSPTTWAEISKEEVFDLSSVTTKEDDSIKSVPDSLKQVEEKKKVVKVSKRRKESWPLLKLKDDLPGGFPPPPKDVRKKPKSMTSILNKRYGINPTFDYKMDLFKKFLEDEAANILPINEGTQPKAGPSSAVQNDETVTEKVLLKMAVWDKNPMDIEKITMLHIALTGKEKQLSRVCKYRPEFRSVRKENCLHVTCDDAFTADWVKRTLRGLKLWEDIQLEFKEQEPTQPLAAILHAKLSEANTPAEAMALLQSQNPKLKVFEWKKYHVVNKKYVNLIFFVIPESTLGVLEKTNHWVNFGDTKTYVQVNYDYETMKVPIKPSKKPTIRGIIGTGYF